MHVAVIGGGLQGACLALELAQQGVRVDVIERERHTVNRASRHNEGKVHLGYVYSADTSLKTARLMARGAASFFPSLRRWLGESVDDLIISAPFRYAIPHSSMISASDLEDTYRLISAIVDDEFAGAHQPSDVSPSHLRRLERGESDDYSDDVDRVIETGEIAVDTDSLCDAVDRALHARTEITVRTATTVVRVDAGRRMLDLEHADGSAEKAGSYDHIVNCSWSSLPSLDATAGLMQDRAWCFRVKYFLRLDAAQMSLRIPSTTFALGAYGDVVDFGSAGSYLSWYDAGRKGFTTALEPPNWPSRLSLPESTTTACDIIDGLSTFMPRLQGLRAIASTHGVVRGGVIFAHGVTDLDDDCTELHQRHSIGPTSMETYHSVNTGKLTMAPYFARTLADRLSAKR